MYCMLTVLCKESQDKVKRVLSNGTDDNACAGHRKNVEKHLKYSCQTWKCKIPAKRGKLEKRIHRERDSTFVYKNTLYLSFFIRHAIWTPVNMWDWLWPTPGLDILAYIAECPGFRSDDVSDFYGTFRSCMIVWRRLLLLFCDINKKVIIPKYLLIHLDHLSPPISSTHGSSFWHRRSQVDICPNTQLCLA